MLKNLNIVSAYKSELSKKEIHKIVKYLRDELLISFLSLQINIVDSEQVLDLNKKYLNHDYNTDIITFDYSENLNHLDGEIFISFQDAVKNAKKYKVKTKEEIIRLIVHGILHLSGYDDQKPADKRKMKTKENYLLNEIKEIINV